MRRLFVRSLGLQEYLCKLEITGLFFGVAFANACSHKTASSSAAVSHTLLRTSAVSPRLGDGQQAFSQPASIALLGACGSIGRPSYSMAWDAFQEKFPQNTRTPCQHYFFILDTSLLRAVIAHVVMHANLQIIQQHAASSVFTIMRVTWNRHQSISMHDLAVTTGRGLRNCQ